MSKSAMRSSARHRWPRRCERCRGRTAPGDSGSGSGCLRREAEHETEAVPVAWHERETDALESRAMLRSHPAVDADRSAGRPPESRDGFDELVLTVARDAGDAQDLAAADLQQMPSTASWRRSSARGGLRSRGSSLPDATRRDRPPAARRGRPSTRPGRPRSFGSAAAAPRPCRAG